MASLSSNIFLISIALFSLVATSFGNFNQDFDISWGNGRGKILDNGELVTLSLDQYSGSGFQSKNEYIHGQVDMQIKLVPGNSAGTITSYYFTSQGNARDEIDIEFLGNLDGQPYTLQTNIYTQGYGEREQRMHLWFDPTADFHTYTILWNPAGIIFYVDGTPIREYKNYKAKGVPYPDHAMRLQASLWNGDTWATGGGRIKIDWSKAPFTASFRQFRINGCVFSNGHSSCNSPTDPFRNSPSFTKVLDSNGKNKLRGVQQKYMYYDYCKDTKRFPKGFPQECTLA